MKTLSPVFLAVLLLSKCLPVAIFGFEPSTVTPVPSNLKKFMPKLFQEKLRELENGKIEFVMIGDSITHSWSKYRRTFKGSNLLNLGFPGDRTQNVLWRIENGALDGISPKLVTLMIGTNNMHDTKKAYPADKPDEIFAGIQAIVTEVRTRLPNTKIVVFSVFPRKEGSENERVKAVNEMLPQLADGKYVSHIDLNRFFINENGQQDKTLYNKDLLHFNEKGYLVWAQALKPLLERYGLRVNLNTLRKSTNIPLSATNYNKPNIIYLMLDEWGYFESSLMGHPILNTPNIDKVASEGLRFTQFLAGASVCAPTRSTLITGQHTGHTTVRGPGCLRADEVTVPSMLKDAGYATGGFGKWGLGDVGTTGVPEKHGFDVFFGYYNQTHAHTFYPKYLIRNSKKVPLAGNTGDFLKGETFSHSLIFKASLDFIQENKDRPFFAYLPWTPPHGFWTMPDNEPAWKKYKDRKWDAANQKGTHDAQMYAAMIEMVDRQIGVIMDLLKKLRIDDNTIVFISGDNGGKSYFKNDKYPHGFLAPNLNPKTGERFRGGKGDFYEGGIRVPFIVRWPGKIKAGTVSEHLGYFPDVMPTLAEIANAKPRKDTDGISILPTLLGSKTVGRKQSNHEYLYWENKKSVALRMNDWKAIRPNKNMPFELYDLSKDIEEFRNVATQYPDIIKKVTSYAKRAHAPVRLGKVIDASLGFKGHKED